jgi:SAM-dependent methyltransferase
MAANLDAIIANLSSFWDPKEKSVLHVGAGGGQLIGYARDARSVVAVDSDPLAVSRLETALQASDFAGRFRVVLGEFLSFSGRADVVFFEFCLHEMDDPGAALLHAGSLAPEILVLDHLPDSRWAWHTCEEDKAARAWDAVRQLGTAREASFRATQHFDAYADLLSRVEPLGPEAIDRSRQWSGQEDIRIDMRYGMALLGESAGRN